MTAETTTREAPASAVTRVVRVVRTLIEVHLESAQREAERDRERLAGGIAYLMFGLLLLGMLVVMLHVGAACLVHERGWTWGRSVFAVAGADLVVGVGFLMAGRRRVGGPVMPETRGLIRRTVEALVKG
ncbi:MAG: phage holin family protein [Deltaproteobacteria bacterium]